MKKRLSMEKLPMIEIKGNFVKGFIKKFPTGSIWSGGSCKAGYAFIPKNDDDKEKMIISRGFPVTRPNLSFAPSGINIIKEDFSLDKEWLDELIDELQQISDQIGALEAADKLERA